MNLISISGKVGNVRIISSTSGGTVPGTYRIKIDTSHTTSFRVNGKQMVARGALTISDGDYATIVGIERSGKFFAYAMRNDATGDEKIEKIPSYILPVALIIFGVPLIPFIVGVPMIMLGIWLVFKTRSKKKIIADAVCKLRSLPHATDTSNI